MKVYLLKNRIIQSMVLIVMLMLSSCIDDIESVPNPNSLNKSALITVQMPTSITSALGISDIDENRVEEIDVLAFTRDPSDNTKWVFNYLATGDNIVDVGDETDITKSQKRFSITVQILSAQQKFVVIANAHEQITQLNNLSVGTRESVLLGQLLSNNTGKWDAMTRPFPMWGELTATITSATSEIGIVNLLRSIARVDVVVGSDASDAFEMTDVYIYKSMVSGNIVPDSTNYSNDIPTIPSNVINDPLQYDIPTTDPVTTIFEKELYIAEAAAATADTRSKATAIVVGGYYNGGTTKTYYRIDFMLQDTKAYVPVLRNHQYIFNIKSVSKAGKDTPDDAYNATDVDMNVSVTDWDLTNVGDVIFPGEYYIQFRPSRELEFYSDAATQVLDIQTTYPEGFKIVKYVEVGTDGISETDLPSTGGWISTNPVIGTGYGADQSDVSVNVTVTKNSGATNRVGYIYIQVGNEVDGEDKLTVKVKVTQNQYQALSLHVTDLNGTDITNLLFQQTVAGTAPSSQKFMVTWEPTNESVTVNNEQVGSVVFPSGGTTNVPLAGTSLTSSTGTTTFEIKPTAITSEELTGNEFLERTSKLTFFVTNADGTESIQKELILKQIIPNFITIPSSLETDYDNLLDGGTYQFSVRSNYAWRIASITENGVGGFLNYNYGNLKVGTQGAANTTAAGTTINFKTNEKLTGNLETVTIVFKSTDTANPVADKTITLNLNGQYFPNVATEWAGSNIYFNGTNLTFDVAKGDSLSAKQGVFFKWGSLWGISPANSASTEFSGTTVMYSPNGGSGTASSYGYSSWGNIPQVGSDAFIFYSPTNKSDLDRQYLYEITSSASTIGDICRYLTLKGYAPTGKWRMPTATEMGISTSYTKYPPLGQWINFNTLNDDGKQININGGYAYNSKYFPASGYRDESGTAVNTSYGKELMYFTGSAHGTEAYSMFASQAAVTVANYQSRITAGPIRCVKIE